MCFAWMKEAGREIDTLMQKKNPELVGVFKLFIKVNFFCFFRTVIFFFFSNITNN